MFKTKENNKQKEQKINEEKIEEYIAIDPGVRNTISVVKRCYKNSKIYENNFCLKAHKFHHGTKFFQRNINQLELTKKVDARIKRYLRKYESHEQPSAKSMQFQKFVNFKLKFFNHATEVYMKDEITELKFSKYIETQRYKSTINKRVSIKS